MPARVGVGGGVGGGFAVRGVGGSGDFGRQLLNLHLAHNTHNMASG